MEIVSNEKVEDLVPDPAWEIDWDLDSDTEIDVFVLSGSGDPVLLCGARRPPRQPS